MKRRVGIDKIDPVLYTGSHGDGQTPATCAAIVDVGGQRGPATECRPPVLRASQSRARRGGLRCLRRGAVREVLRGRRRPAVSAAGSLLPDAVAWLLRGPGVGAGDGVARSGFVEPAAVPRHRAARGSARPLDGLADTAPDRRRDARGGLHVGAAARGRRRLAQGADGRHRRDDAGSERGAAEHRSSGHGRGLRRVPARTGGGVRHSDADPGRAGPPRPEAAEEGLERRLDASAGPGCEDHEDAGRPDPPGPQGRACRRPGDGRRGRRHRAGRQRRRHDDDGRDADHRGGAGRSRGAGRWRSCRGGRRQGVPQQRDAGCVDRPRAAQLRVGAGPRSATLARQTRRPRRGVCQPTTDSTTPRSAAAAPARRTPRAPPRPSLRDRALAPAASAGARQHPQAPPGARLRLESGPAHATSDGRRHAAWPPGPRPGAFRRPATASGRAVPARVAAGKRGRCSRERPTVRHLVQGQPRDAIMARCPAKR